MKFKLFFKMTIVVSVLFLLTSCISGGVNSVNRGNFGEFKRSLNHKKHGYQIVTDPTGKAPTELVERFEVQPGDCSSQSDWNDCSSDRERSELTEWNKKNPIGTEEWYTWSIYFPEDFVNVYPTKVCVGQFHQIDAKMSTWKTEIGEDDGLYINNLNTWQGLQYYKLIDGKELRGKWHNIKIQVKWSHNYKPKNDGIKRAWIGMDDSGPGFMKIWVNGKLKLDYEGRTCMKSKMFFKYGIYRAHLSRYKNLNNVDEVPGQVVLYSNMKRTKL